MKDYTKYANFLIEKNYRRPHIHDVDRVLLSEAILKYGVEPQLNQLIEEMAELTVAINHGRRHNDLHEIGIVEEIADVIICLQQLIIIASHDIGDYGFDDYIDQEISRKEERLRKRLKIDRELLAP